DRCLACAVLLDPVAARHREPAVLQLVVQHLRTGIADIPDLHMERKFPGEWAAGRGTAKFQRSAVATGLHLARVEYQPEGRRGAATQRERPAYRQEPVRGLRIAGDRLFLDENMQTTAGDAPAFPNEIPCRDGEVLLLQRRDKERTTAALADTNIQ